MLDNDYYAHSGTQPNRSDWQTLRSHLQGVAEKSTAMMRACNVSDELCASSFVAGLLHDLGKYRPEFQQMLRGASPPKELTYHKQAGAAKAVGLGDVPVSFAIAGHHGGLPNKVKLEELIKSESGRSVALEVWPEAIRDLHMLDDVKAKPPTVSTEDGDLVTRMIFSCLVDADWQDTGNHELSTLGAAAPEEPEHFTADVWLEKLLATLDSKASNCVEPTIRNARCDVLDACLASAENDIGVYSLCVPTGGGKTLASIAFALKHAIRNRQRRIIYVAPYVTILEQNEVAIREALGISNDSRAIFTHHCLSDPIQADDQFATTDDAVRRAENWDAPIVITTNVQFFESLFSNKPGRCRKIHNIANSVVILDECQSIPPSLVAPTCSMLRQLSTKWNLTIVLCTATQPAFGHEELEVNERLIAHEIVPRELALFDRLKRVEIDLSNVTASRSSGLSWAEIAQMMLRSKKKLNPQALCIVNSKRAARELYSEIAQIAEGISFHLSTSMCPAHRLRVLDTVRKRLSKGEACLLVSTQLIEAGVDVDFPMVLRELAPLESIIQSAGRCNREGMLRDESGLTRGEVIVFQTQSGLEYPSRYYPPDEWYQAGRLTLVNSFLNASRVPRIDSAEDINEYYVRLFHSGDLDKHEIQKARHSFRFEDVAKDYRLISDETIGAIVATWEPERALIENLIVQLRRNPNREGFRKLAVYQVALRAHQARNAGNLLSRVSEKIDQPVWFGQYDNNLGLSLEVNDGLMMY